MRLPTVRSLLLLACLCSATGCVGMLTPSATYQANPKLLALAPAVVFQGSEGPLSYQTAVGQDGQRLMPAMRVRGQACQRGIQIPILGILMAASDSSVRGAPGSLSAGWGDGGFEAALDDARRQLPREAILYDVIADLSHRSILTVYREQCVLIDAGVLVPAVASPTPVGAL